MIKLYKHDKSFLPLIILLTFKDRFLIIPIITPKYVRLCLTGISAITVRMLNPDTEENCCIYSTTPLSILYRIIVISASWDHLNLNIWHF